jgi:hypothetical protein
MQRSRFFVIFSILTVACASSLTAIAQDAPKDKQKDQPGHSTEAVQKRADPSLKPQQGQRVNPGANAKAPAPQKQMVLTPQQQLDQQASQREAWQQRRANHWDYEHQNWQQRGGYKGVRIPDDYFHSNYGSNHVFRMINLPFAYQDGNPRFQYGGYWFTMLDPYPDNWSGYWYEDDDLFVDYRGDGYYLFNRGFPNQPGVAIQVTI